MRLSREAPFLLNEPRFEACLTSLPLGLREIFFLFPLLVVVLELTSLPLGLRERFCLFPLLVVVLELTSACAELKQLPMVSYQSGTKKGERQQVTRRGAEQKKLVVVFNTNTIRYRKANNDG